MWLPGITGRKLLVGSRDRMLNRAPTSCHAAESQVTEYPCLDEFLLIANEVGEAENLLKQAVISS